MSLQVAFPSPEEHRETYDAIVVGTGTVELAAAIYLTRVNLKTLVYVAGDITCGRDYQITVSICQGVTATLGITRSHTEARRKQKS